MKHSIAMILIRLAPWLLALTLAVSSISPAGMALEERLGFRLPPLPHVNRSDRAADWRGLYDDATRDAVARMCAADIARFGYRFEYTYTVV